jgi:hypothetical protein
MAHTIFGQWLKLRVTSANWLSPRKHSSAPAASTKALLSDESSLSIIQKGPPPKDANFIGDIWRTFRKNKQRPQMDVGVPIKIQDVDHLLDSNTSAQQVFN